MLSRIEIKVYEPTTHRGLRFKLTINGCPVLKDGKKFIVFDYYYNSVFDQAEAILKRLGWTEEQYQKVTESKDGYVVLAERW